MSQTNDISYLRYTVYDNFHVVFDNNLPYVK